MAFDVRGVAPLLGVYDMPVSVHFYCDLLGFEIASHSPVTEEGYFHWAWLRLGKAKIMLNTNFESNKDRPAHPDRLRNVAHRDTCLYLGCPDVDAAYAELRGKGVEAKEPVVTHYGMKQMYLVDPDGYGICFQWRAQNTFD
jgi:catechol 2,3-dioxygenase-like lactoylglutathione lyase family enzyme